MFKPPKANETAAFYDGLIGGRVGRLVWGAGSRFDPEKIANSASARMHYEPLVRAYCRSDSRVLDIGCSTGGFTGILGKHCGQVTGVDLSPGAVEIANSFFEANAIDNCTALVGNGEQIALESESIDLIQLVDVIHHAENSKKLMDEAYRLLKKDGRIVIFEPNKFNLLLFLMCLFDRNEWGALQLGSKNAYRKLLSNRFHIETIQYNGLLVGPDGAIARKIANFLSVNRGNPILGSQCPKIHIVLRRKDLA